MSIPPTQRSVRPSPVFLALVALTAFGGALAWLAKDSIGPLAYAGVFILVVAGWVVSLCLHEFGHAYTAWRFGDHDVALRGYLTLNPLKFFSPLLSLGLPVLFIALGGFGLPGAATYVRTDFMTARQRTIVSLAGPLANLILAAVLLGLTRWYVEGTHPVFWAGVAFLGFLQVTAVVLNLLPVPGLDGYGALEPHLSAETQQALAPVKPYGFLIVLVLILAPILNRWFFDIVYWLFGLSGVSPLLAAAGGQLIRFWSIGG